MNSKIKYLLSCRVQLAIVGFIGSMFLYALRMNMSVAILCMTNHTAVDLLANKSEFSDKIYNSTNSDSSCHLQSSKKMLDGELVWDKTTRGVILGVFFWGYLVTQIPAGLIIRRVGAKIIILIFIAISSVATILTPVAARVSVAFVIFLRVLSGICSAVWFPCFHHMWSHWAPLNERSILVGITYAGIHMGNALTLPIAGYLCEYGFGGGWPSIFYLFGGFSLLWCVLWFFVVYDGPTKHPRISSEEKEYITKSLEGQISDNSMSLKIPFRKFATSLPVWAIIVMNITFDWNGYLFLTSVPTYMKDVLKFDISENGGLSSVPYFAFWFGQIIFAFLSDFIISRKWLSVTWTRKIMTAIGMLTPGVIVVILGYLTCEYKYLAVGLLTIGLTFNSAVFVGGFVNHVDIAPRYSGILFAISNSIAALTGFFAPTTVGALTSNNLLSEWRIVFFICAAIYAFGGIFFMVFASGEIQPWAMEKPNTQLEIKDAGNGEEMKPLNKANGAEA